MVEVVDHLSSQLGTDVFGSQGCIGCLLTLAQVLRDANSCYLTLLHGKVKELVPSALTVWLLEVFQDILAPQACFQTCEYDTLHSVYSTGQEKPGCTMLFE
jgi:hypothetical protein